MAPYQLMNFNKHYQMVIRSTALYTTLSAILSSESEYLQQLNKISNIWCLRPMPVTRGNYLQAFLLLLCQNCLLEWFWIFAISEQYFRYLVWQTKRISIFVAVTLVWRAHMVEWNWELPTYSINYMLWFWHIPFIFLKWCLWSANSKENQRVFCSLSAK